MNQPYSGTTPYMYPLRTGPFDYWAYASQYSSSQANQTQYPYTYNGYYPTQMAGTAQHHNPYAYTQTYNPNQNLNNQLNWQRPYQGLSVAPKEGISMAQGSSSTGTMHRFRLEPSRSGTQSQTQTSTQQPSHSRSSPSNQLSSTSSEQPGAPTTSESLNTEKAAAEPSTSTSNAGEPVDQVSSIHKDLSVLASLQPSQIAEILYNNPEIQGILLAAVDRAMAQARDEAA